MDASSAVREVAVALAMIAVALVLIFRAAAWRASSGSRGALAMSGESG
jgi:hypothetical protein